MDNIAGSNQLALFRIKESQEEAESPQIQSSAQQIANTSQFHHISLKYIESQQMLQKEEALLSQIELNSQVSYHDQDIKIQEYNNGHLNPNQIEYNSQIKIETDSKSSNFKSSQQLSPNVVDMVFGQNREFSDKNNGMKKMSTKKIELNNIKSPQHQHRTIKLSDNNPHSILRNNSKHDVLIDDTNIMSALFQEENNILKSTFFQNQKITNQEKEFKLKKSIHQNIMNQKRLNTQENDQFKKQELKIRLGNHEQIIEVGQAQTSLQSQGILNQNNIRIVKHRDNQINASFKSETTNLNISKQNNKVNTINVTNISSELLPPTEFGNSVLNQQRNSTYKPFQSNISPQKASNMQRIYDRRSATKDSYNFQRGTIQNIQQIDKSMYGSKCSQFQKILPIRGQASKISGNKDEQRLIKFRNSDLLQINQESQNMILPIQIQINENNKTIKNHSEEKNDSFDKNSKLKKPMNFKEQQVNFDNHISLRNHNLINPHGLINPIWIKDIQQEKIFSPNALQQSIKINNLELSFMKQNSNTIKKRNQILNQNQSQYYQSKYNSLHAVYEEQNKNLIQKLQLHNQNSGKNSFSLGSTFHKQNMIRARILKYKNSKNTSINLKDNIYDDKQIKIYNQSDQKNMIRIPGIEIKNGEGFQQYTLNTKSVNDDNVLDNNFDIDSKEILIDSQNADSKELILTQGSFNNQVLEIILENNNNYQSFESNQIEKQQMGTYLNGAKLEYQIEENKEESDNNTRMIGNQSLAQNQESQPDVGFLQINSNLTSKLRDASKYSLFRKDVKGVKDVLFHQNNRNSTESDLVNNKSANQNISQPHDLKIKNNEQSVLANDSKDEQDQLDVENKQEGRKSVQQMEREKFKKNLQKKGTIQEGIIMKIVSDSKAQNNKIESANYIVTTERLTESINHYINPNENSNDTLSSIINPNLTINQSLKNHKFVSKLKNSDLNPILVNNTEKSDLETQNLQVPINLNTLASDEKKLIENSILDSSIITSNNHNHNKDILNLKQKKNLIQQIQHVKYPAWKHAKVLKNLRKNNIDKQNSSFKQKKSLDLRDDLFIDATKVNNSFFQLNNLNFANTSRNEEQQSLFNKSNSLDNKQNFQQIESIFQLQEKFLKLLQMQLNLAIKNGEPQQQQNHVIPQVILSGSTPSPPLRKTPRQSLSNSSQINDKKWDVGSPQSIYIKHQNSESPTLRSELMNGQLVIEESDQDHFTYYDENMQSIFNKYKNQIFQQPENTQNLQSTRISQNSNRVRQNQQNEILKLQEEISNDIQKLNRNSGSQDEAILNKLKIQQNQAVLNSLISAAFQQEDQQHFELKILQNNQNQQDQFQKQRFSQNVDNKYEILKNLAKINASINYKQQMLKNENSSKYQGKALKPRKISRINNLQKINQNLRIVNKSRGSTISQGSQGKYPESFRKSYDNQRVLTPTEKIQEMDKIKLEVDDNKKEYVEKILMKINPQRIKMIKNVHSIDLKIKRNEYSKNLKLLKYGVLNKKNAPTSNQIQSLNCQVGHENELSPKSKSIKSFQQSNIPDEYTKHQNMDSQKLDKNRLILENQYDSNKSIISKNECLSKSDQINDKDLKKQTSRKSVFSIHKDAILSQSQKDFEKNQNKSNDQFTNIHSSTIIVKEDEVNAQNIKEEDYLNQDSLITNDILQKDSQDQVQSIEKYNQMQIANEFLKSYIQTGKIINLDQIQENLNDSKNDDVDLVEEQPEQFTSNDQNYSLYDVQNSIEHEIQRNNSQNSQKNNTQNSQKNMFIEEELVEIYNQQEENKKNVLQMGGPSQKTLQLISNRLQRWEKQLCFDKNYYQEINQKYSQIQKQEFKNAIESLDTNKFIQKYMFKCKQQEKTEQNNINFLTAGLRSEDTLSAKPFDNQFNVRYQKFSESKEDTRIRVKLKLKNDNSKNYRLSETADSFRQQLNSVQVQNQQHSFKSKQQLSSPNNDTQNNNFRNTIIQENITPKLNLQNDQKKFLQTISNQPFFQQNQLTYRDNQNNQKNRNQMISSEKIRFRISKNFQKDPKFQTIYQIQSTKNKKEEYQYPQLLQKSIAKDKPENIQIQIEKQPQILEKITVQQQQNYFDNMDKTIAIIEKVRQEQSKIYKQKIGSNLEFKLPQVKSSNFKHQISRDKNNDTRFDNK